MKVTFIYAYDPSELWSTPMSLATEFEFRGWEVEIVTIGSNRTGVYHDRELRTWVESKPETDLVIFMDWGRFDSPWLDKKHVPAAKWVQESGDDPQNFAANSPKAHKFDLTLTPDYPSHLKYVEMGINALWWTHFADTRIHMPMVDVHPEYVAVTSRGMGGSEFLDTLTHHSDGMIVNQRGHDGIHHSIFLQKGLMVIQNSRWGEITRRIFEAMACGRMVLTDRLHPDKRLDEMFKDRLDIVYYDSLEDCINLINYYAEHHEERELIAANGRRAVMAGHTQSHRADAILKNLGYL